ncbi:Hypothetical_protein [Hexamita inflata]|uniref:Hypothetical_protein n=1 Tax=Hexamita inflata TaxID=28002 RepID=A0AA86S436_9EUKA|nr:Hypothetical protein HINF_LOCUS65320 [Hexamita inflata]
MSYFSVQQISGQISPNNVLNRFNSIVRFKETVNGAYQTINLYDSFEEYQNKVINQSFIDNFVDENDADLSSIKVYDTFDDVEIGNVNKSHILYYYLKYNKFQTDYVYKLYMNNELVDILIFNDINLKGMNSSVFFWQQQNSTRQVKFKLTDIDDNEVHGNLIIRLLVK